MSLNSINAVGYNAKLKGVMDVRAVEHQRDIPKSFSDTRKALVSLGTFRAPKGQENLYLIYCCAIVDAILELHRASNNLYSKIVMQWGDPDCQAVVRKFEANCTHAHTLVEALGNMATTSASTSTPDRAEERAEQRISRSRQGVVTTTKSGQCQTSFNYLNCTKQTLCSDVTKYYIMIFNYDY